MDGALGWQGIGRQVSILSTAYCFRLLIGALGLCLASNSAYAQRVRFTQANPVPSTNFQNYPQSFPLNNSPGVLPSTAPSAVGSIPSFGNPAPVFGNGGLNPIPNNSTFAPPGFDPYASTVRPSSAPSGFSNPLGNLFGAQPSLAQNPFQYQPQQPTFSNPYPSSVYPNQAPPALFPGTPSSNWGSSGGVYPQGSGGLFGGLFGQPNYGQAGPTGFGNGWYSSPNGPIWSGGAPQPMRFFLGPRFRHTFVYGSKDPTALETNDTDASLVFGIPNFLGSTQPLYVVPSFSIHTFEGPRLPAADLPGSAYSAFLDLGWESDPVRTFGADLGIRTGVFTDFHTFTGDSFRIQAKGLGRVRLTPNATLRLGVLYIDRNRYKLIPAGGILWTPNQDTRFDIYFPEPKLSHYLTTLGTTDAWWYLTGYYGGGTWTVTRASNQKDSIDVNEMCIALGMEFGRNDMIRQGRRLGFVEAGYAFHRELLYKHRPQDNTDIQDAFIVRAGVGY